ncbi:MAG: nucleotidyltransferase domain-containing protein [Deltaproteobacteria bacterium]|nr:nucleotidyltransferase domain-containing protein [Deltaproteobacteria bacterium]
MDDEDRRILRLFASRVRERFPEAEVWAFGSRARGGARWDSDFDVCVVLETVDRASRAVISDLAWEVGYENERVITLVPFSKEDFEAGPPSESTLVQTILREGVRA